MRIFNRMAGGWLNACQTESIFRYVDIIPYWTPVVEVFLSSIAVLSFKTCPGAYQSLDN
jgi:hypothetical protein